MAGTTAGGASYLTECSSFMGHIFTAMSGLDQHARQRVHHLAGAM